jgi:hypothetical protein
MQTPNRARVAVCVSSRPRPTSPSHRSAPWSMAIGLAPAAGRDTVRRMLRPAQRGCHNGQVPSPSSALQLHHVISRPASCSSSPPCPNSIIVCELPVPCPCPCTRDWPGGHSKLSWAVRVSSLCCSSCSALSQHAIIHHACQAASRSLAAIC